MTVNLSALENLEILLTDLVNSGVTDIVAESEADFFTKKDSFTPLATAKTVAQPASPQVQSNPQATTNLVDAIKERQATTAESFSTKEVKSNIKINPEELFFLQKSTEEDQPLIAVGTKWANFNSIEEALGKQEHTLLSNMLKAINLDINKVNLILISGFDKRGIEITKTNIEPLQNATKQAISDISFNKALVLGKWAADIMCGRKISPSDLKENSIEIAEKPATLTHSPHILIKQPLFKRKAWEMLLKFSS